MGPNGTRDAFTVDLVSSGRRRTQVRDTRSAALLPQIDVSASYTNQQYTAGVSSYLDVLDAQRHTFAAEVILRGPGAID